MFWGVFTGVFSSMFIAPAILLYIRHRWPLHGHLAPKARHSSEKREPVATGR
jgi:preprotein translocase subunit SecF